MTLDLAKLRELQDRAAAIEGVPLLSREWAKAIGVLREAVFAQFDPLLTAAEEFEEFDKHRLSAAHWEDLAAKYKTERDEARAECERLKRDVERHMQIANEHIAECERLRRDGDRYLSALKTAMHGEDLGYVWEVCSEAIDAASAEGGR